SIIAWQALSAIIAFVRRHLSLPAQPSRGRNHDGLRRHRLPAALDAARARGSSRDLVAVAADAADAAACGIPADAAVEGPQIDRGDPGAQPLVDNGAPHVAC